MDELVNESKPGICGKICVANGINFILNICMMLIKIHWERVQAGKDSFEKKTKKKTVCKPVNQILPVNLTFVILPLFCE